MKKSTLFLALILLISTCGLIHAQTFNLQTGREPIASLDGLWRFHTGDNPAWASPNFDDSQWPLLRSDRPWTAQGYKDYGGFAWYRLHLVVPVGLDHVSVLLPPLATSYEIYGNGKEIGHFGEMPPYLTARSSMTAEYRLQLVKMSGPREVTVALRVWQSPKLAAYYGGGPRRGGALAGDSAKIDARFQRLKDTNLLRNGGAYTAAIFDGIAGIVALLLFLVRPTETEYFWFALCELTIALFDSFRIYSNVHSVPITGANITMDLLRAIAGLSYILFLQTLLRGRRSVLFSLAIAGQLASFAIEISRNLRFLPNAGAVDMADAVCTLAVFIWLGDLLARRVREKMPDARLLLAPALIFIALEWIGAALAASYELGWQKAFTGNFVLLTHPFTVSAYVLGQVLLLLAMLAILVNRFMRSRREEQRYASEFEAARGMQSLMIPAIAPSTPGFQVESVYLPASEVGGDFFQILPGEDGSLLIVVGDVSGKGLKAAMTVSTIVGALRGCTTRKPSEVLAYLNRVLHGQVSGFVTCSAALIVADGKLTIANAGHLSPYCNGEELTVAGGLPLGIVVDGNYAETRYQLAAGDRLTFMSDGVVEATNEKKELFGFERTQQISNQPAAAIAKAAQQFGQEDDISVLSVTRNANMKAAIA